MAVSFPADQCHSHGTALALRYISCSCCRSAVQSNYLDLRLRTVHIVFISLFLQSATETTCTKRCARMLGPLYLMGSILLHGTVWPTRRKVGLLTGCSTFVALCVIWHFHGSG